MNMQFKIESGIAIPEGHAPYPFADMKVGDSFAFPDDGKRNKYNQHPKATRVMAAAIYWSKAHNPSAKFMRRRITENGEFVFRIWRIK